MIKSNDYWKKREAAEKEWQKQAEKNMQAYNQHIAQMYQNAIDEINRQIKSDLGFADNKLITAKDMQEYETLAKEAVKKANALRAKGHYVTRKDFSKDVNDRLKVYNATMRINRNEILKSKIGARLVELGIEQETDLTNKLWNDYTKEKERQAGILGITAKSDLWTSKEVQGQIYKQIANASFSQRIWADIDGLKGQLDGLVSTAIIRGDNPKVMAQWLTGMVSTAVGNQRYVAERLARTETARVQFEAQQKSIIDAGYKYVKWMAEGSACKLCREIAYKDNGYDEDGVYKAKDVPDIPVHPNCMCSISAYWVEDKKNDVNSDIVDYSKPEFYDTSSFKSYKPNSSDEKIMQEQAHKWFNELKPDEQDAIMYYTRDTMHDINHFLINGEYNNKMFGWEHAKPEVIKTKNAEMHKRIDDLNSALNKAEPVENFVTKRAVDYNEWEEMKKLVGKKTFSIFERYKSTSPFNGDYPASKYITYYIPKGAKGSYLGDISDYKSEKEYLLKAGQKFLVKQDGKELKVYVFPNT
ncbi:ADP-ribosyltransferase [Lactobacillus crispatus]|uniref:ADP-ribosyltransferase n=1 Tax=Lactobacillus crispatus TaxID=47770 RepID=UPI003F25C88A